MTLRTTQTSGRIGVRVVATLVTLAVKADVTACQLFARVLQRGTPGAPTALRLSAKTRCCPRCFPLRRAHWSESSSPPTRRPWPERPRRCGRRNAGESPRRSADVYLAVEALYAATSEGALYLDDVLTRPRVPELSRLVRRCIHHGARRPVGLAQQVLDIAARAAGWPRSRFQSVSVGTVLLPNPATHAKIRLFDGVPFGRPLAKPRNDRGRDETGSIR